MKEPSEKWFYVTLAGILAVLLALILAPRPASAASSADLDWAGATITAQHEICWSDMSACWMPFNYAFPALPTYTDASTRNGSGWLFPPPTALAQPQGWNPRFPQQTGTMFWGQIPGDRCGRWAWLNVFSGNLSSYERGQSVGGAFGPLAATQDGIHPTPALPSCGR